MYEQQQEHHQQQGYQQQQLYGSGDPASVPYPQWSVCAVNITHQNPMTYMFRAHTDDLPESIIGKIHMMLAAYTGAERTPPESRGPERTHAFYQCVREHPRVRDVYMADAEKADTFACYAGMSEEDLTKEPYASMPGIGIPPANPHMSIYGWLRFVGVDLVLTDCKNPGEKEVEATGFYKTVSELEADCAGARLLRLLTDNQAFTKLDIINLNITESFCSEDKTRSLDLYRSARFCVRAKHVNVKIRWDTIPFGSYEMDFHPQLREIICPQLQGRNKYTPGSWQMGYSS